MRPSRLLAVVASSFLALSSGALSAAAAASTAARDGTSEFADALAQARKSLEAHRAKEAQSQLAAALAAHTGQAYVKASLPAVREIAATCAFEIATPRRYVKDVFCGTVSSYDAKTGKIALRWEKPKPVKDEAPPAFPCDDFETTPWGRVLKLPFDGPCSIELSGKALGQRTPIVRMGYGEERAVELRLDAGSLNVIGFVTDEVFADFGSSSTIFNVARPYKLEVYARAAQFEAKHNGTRLVVGPRLKGEPYGRIGYKDVLDPLLIVVEGTARTAWIEAAIAELAKADRAAFDARYDVNADLPAWLRIP